MIATSQNGTSTETNGSWRPTIFEISNASRPVTCPATRMGIPIEPNATGAVFATRQSPAA